MRHLEMHKRGGEAGFFLIQDPATCDACHYKLQPDQPAAVVTIREHYADPTKVIHDDETCFWVLANGFGLKYEPEDLR